MMRYQRQIILPDMGHSGQSLLEAAHVLVVGAGGLGVPVLQYLAGAGVGQISIVDPDIISLNNLHRQVMYQENHVGQSKVKIAAQILSGLNSDIKIHPTQCHLDPSNVDHHLSNVSLVLDCADSFAVSYILSDHCFSKNIPFISASALAKTGYVGGFCSGAPSLRAVFPQLPNQAGNCETSGVFGPIVGTIGSIQAQMALNVLLGTMPSPLGLLVKFDGADFRFSNFRFDKAKEPCENIFRFISPRAISDEDFVIELRGLDETENAITEHALRVPIDQFDPLKNFPRPRQRAVFVCRSGIRAQSAARRLQQTKNHDGDIVLVATN